MCLGEPLSLSLQTIPTQAPTPAPVRCVSEQGFGLPTPMCAVLPNRGSETRIFLCAVTVRTGRRRELGAARQAAIRRSGSSRFRAMEQAA